MAYKGQKVQKVMVQPIVSFLIVMKELMIALKSVEMATPGSTCYRFDKYLTLVMLLKLI